MKNSLKETLLDTAQHLMQTKGFTATTVDEICEKAGISKGGFFHHFKSKEDLAQQTLDYFIGTIQSITEQAHFMKRTDPIQRVYGYIDFIVKMSKHPVFRNGCLLGSFSQELADTNPRIREQCSNHFTNWVNMFKADIEKARAQIKPKAVFNAKGLAEQLIITLEGALILAKAKNDISMVEKSMRHFKKYLDYLFQK